MNLFHNKNKSLDYTKFFNSSVQDSCSIGEDEFIFQINTNLGNNLKSYNFEPPTNGLINYNIDWGDSSNNTVTTSSGLTHSYISHGIYTIKVLITSGITSPNLRFGVDKEKVIDILDWGIYNGWTSLQSMFYTMNNLPTVLSVNTILDCTNVTLVRNAFWNTSVKSCNVGCFKNLSKGSQFFQTFGNPFNDITIGNLDTSQITTFHEMFQGLQVDIDVSKFDVSNVIYMTNMFKNSLLGNLNYQNLLIGWTGWNGTTATKTLQNNVPVHFGIAQYEIGGQSEDARNYLINTLGWTITDGGGI